MKITKFIICLVLTMGLTYLLNQSIPLSTPIPPVGKLLNPFTGFWQNAAADEALMSNYSFDQLKGKVEVVFDDRLVPHIFAEQDLDAYFVQGYLTAKHRLWQMDISTRSTSGRLSEIMGAEMLSRDQQMRRKGLVYAAENALKSWTEKEEELALLDAYTSGVNAYIDALAPKDYPLEFKLLDYEPEPWSNLKSALLLKAMALTLCSTENDIESSNTLDFFGREAFDFLYPEYNPKQSPIIPKEIAWNFDTVTLPTTNPIMIGAIPHKPYEKPYTFAGSNNWAVDGSKTASGNPILCNDPHLGLTLPSIWYEVQIKTPDHNVYGVSLPGFPGVVIGFNENISWGMTNVSHDVLDWYKIRWTDSKRDHYLLDDQVKPVSFRYETYQLSTGETIVDTVRYTEWGPIVYESKDHPKHDMAMRWLAHDPGSNELRMFHKLNAAKNYAEYIDAIKTFHTPAQNIVFASREGDIALKVQGKLPLRSPEQGRFVLDGSNSDNAWKGFIPMDQTPAVKNPQRGFVSSTNQHSTGTDYPYYYHGSFDDYRGRLLNRLLDSLSGITAEDMMALQNNNYGLEPEEMLPLLLQHLDVAQLTAEQKEVYNTLKDWDYQYAPDTKAAPIYDFWYVKFYHNVWDEITAYQNEKKVTLTYPEGWRTVALLEEAPEHHFFDKIDTPDKQETAADVVQQTFAEVCTKVLDWKAKGVNQEWKDYKRTTVPHIGFLEGLGSRHLPVGGDANTLNAIQRNFGPSWRMIVELGPKVKAYGVYPGGQSGNPGSYYYDNMLDSWAQGKYYELLFLDKVGDEAGKMVHKATFE